MVRVLALVALFWATACFGQSANQMDVCVRAASGCSAGMVNGVSLGYIQDHTTWGIHFSGTASGTCQTNAAAAFWPSCGPANTVKTTNNDTSGRTPVSAYIVPGQRTMVVLAVEQSLGANFSGTSYTAVNSLAQQWSIHDRLIYPAKDPLLGPEILSSAGLGDGNYWSRTADKVATAATKYDRVIVANISIGGTKIADWAPGGVWNRRLVETVSALNNQFGAITMIHVGIGETDGTAGTSQAAWQASFTSMVTSIRAAGSNAHIFVAQETYQGGTANSTIRAAQAAVVDNVTIFAGEDIDPPVIPDAERNADRTHMNATGADHRATLVTSLIHSHTFPRRRIPNERTGYRGRAVARRRRGARDQVHPDAGRGAEESVSRRGRRIDRKAG